MKKLLVMVAAISLVVAGSAFAAGGTWAADWAP